MTLSSDGKDDISQIDLPTESPSRAENKRRASSCASGKLTAVLLSPEEYEHLQRVEDAYWIARAEAAEARGQWLGPEETMRVLT